MSSQTFGYTGGSQTFVVPPLVSFVSIECWGAEGTAGGGTVPGAGGKGGRIKVRLPVTPGETLTVRVGGKPTTSSAGFNGGGASSTSTSTRRGGGGGGATDVRQGGTDLASRVVVAGGGGGGGGGDVYPVFGGGSDTHGPGGSGGFQSGVGGFTAGTAGPAIHPDTHSASATGGKGGLINGGGQPGTAQHLGAVQPGPTGTPGGLGQGGAWTIGTAGLSNTAVAGGGGGGFYGGGAGCVSDGNPAGAASGGGGGSSYFAGGSTLLAWTDATRSGNGQVIITWTAPPPAPTAVTPSAASTVTTIYVDVTANLVAQADGNLVKLQAQLATDSGFTTNLIDYTQDNTHFIASGAASINDLLVPQIGTWYVRAREVDDAGGVGPWSTFNSFTVSPPAPPVPTLTAPAANATVNTSRPTLVAVLGAASDGRTSGAQWLLSQSPTFASGNVTVNSPNGYNNILYGNDSAIVPTVDALLNGTWYVKVRAIDQFGIASAYSAANQFQVDYKPVPVSMSPTAGAVKSFGATIRFAWSFTDPAPTATQGAYQIIVERISDGASVLDTGKITSTIPHADLAISATYKDTPLRWRIRLWDNNDVVGNYSGNQVFSISDPPVITIVSPTAGGTVNTGRPTFTWTLDAGSHQQAYQVSIRRTSDNVYVYISPWTTSTDLFHTTPNVVLENAENYSVTIQVRDVDLTQSAVSRLFSAAYDAPPRILFTADGTTYDDDGYVSIDWSASSPDPTFSFWRIYRQDVGAGTEPELLAELSYSDLNSYQDWTAASNHYYVYQVTQLADRSGELLESPFDPDPAITSITSSHYWLICPEDPSLNTRVSNVTSDGYDVEYEEADYIVPGRGRRKEYGTRLGVNGSLTAQYRTLPDKTATQQKNELEHAKNELVLFNLRDPFGNVYKVALGNIHVDRIAGTGTNEFVDVTIPYIEVA